MFTLVAILAAVLPTLCYTLLIWWLDRYEKEPLVLLAAAFLWGSLPAIGLALFIGFALTTPLVNTTFDPTPANWGLAPLVEEPIKALALVALFMLARGEFDGPLDGIVYGALIGFGFAMTENLIFFLHAPAERLGELFWLRSVLFGLNHAFFTSLVGVALGAVRFSSRRWLGYAVLPLALALAVALHALHNIAVYGQLLGLAVAWGMQLLGVLVIVMVALLAWRNERRWIAEELGEEISLGTIDTADYVDVISVPRRTRVQTRALLNGGVALFLRTRALHHLMTELALCKYRLRVGDRFQSCAERDELRRSIIALRASMAGRDGLVGEV